jgi:GT2 family glycosyltransferase
LILLNSDCIVTKNWIEGLCAPLLQDPLIGLVGPVSNSAGNEQTIFTQGRTPEEIIEEGLTWVSNSGGAGFETEMLTFFCVALRRDVLDRVGMLDESFGVGFYEDDDYCIRARHEGYKLICAEDVFVYHRGGGSFSRMQGGTRRIMRESRKKLASKHTTARRTHPRDGQLRVIEGYFEQVFHAGLSPRLQYRISNRIRAVESQLPRGIFKKWAFIRRLMRLKERLSQCGVIV